MQGHDAEEMMRALPKAGPQEYGKQKFVPANGSPDVLVHPASRTQDVCVLAAPKVRHDSSRVVTSAAILKPHDK
jgi:hypothetical protein